MTEQLAMPETQPEAEVTPSLLIESLRAERMAHSEQEVTKVVNEIVDVAQLNPEDLFALSSGRKTDLAEGLAAQPSYMSKLLNNDTNQRQAVAFYQGITGREPETSSTAALAGVWPIGEGVSVIVTTDHRYMDSRMTINEAIPLENRHDTIQQFLHRTMEPETKFNEATNQIAREMTTSVRKHYAEPQFTLDKDARRIREFMQQGLVGIKDPAPHKLRSSTRLAHEMTEYLYGLPSHYSHETPNKFEQEGVYFDEAGNFQKVLVKTHQPGVYTALRSADPAQRGDITELPLQIGIEVDAGEVYAAQSYENYTFHETPPFIDSETAGHLLHHFEAAGLNLQPAMRAAFTEAPSIELRYGHAYAYISREVAKLVNDPDRSYSKLFEATSNGEGLKSETELLRKLQSLPNIPSAEASNPMAQTLVNILQEAAARQLGQTSENDQQFIELPASDARIDMRDGSCKDIEVYLEEGYQQSPILWRSKYKMPTVMSLAPVLFRGVHLPAGSLFKAQEDGTYLLCV